ncbi:uncharacterized protein LOC106129069 [Amyelois transitella]|uniref:uncharacterized protein LOC106129069 n=1 Tax=Amyelois transitella TaxID=680683 RepID=UPI00298F75F4|nr:uncharacterized protein LOC106129069 [Amyelois transitella]
MGSVQEEKPPAETPTKPNIRELRNTELVSRLLAATPPYLYSALPLQPHAFFFSEMLRSFVNARHGCRPPHYHRRFKRRSHKYFAENENEWRRDAREWQKPEEEKKEQETRPEVPLELTVEKQQRGREPSPRRSPKLEKSSGSPGPPGRHTFVDVGMEELPKPSPCVGRTPTDPGAAVPPSNLILPPPPPMWYPPLYNPQFGVDPLNFFIDLRVSGHIYDRKRALAEGIDTNINQEVRPDDSNVDKRLGRDFGQRPRHLSAFSVPVRSGNISVDGPDRYFDQTGVKSGKVNGTSYIMRNLKRVYEHLHSNEKDSTKSKDDDAKADSEVDEDVID